MSLLTNVSYFFLPFVYDKKVGFKTIINKLDASANWGLIHDEIKYMLKYVAEKIDSTNKATCQCFHYILNNTARSSFGLGSAEDWFYTDLHDFQGEQTHFGFQILDVQLYCFSTSVGILAFKMHFDNDEPFRISNAQYHLKKVSREPIHNGEKTDPVTLLDLAKGIVGELTSVSSINFFYYANPSTERANVLTYLEVKKQENYNKELYYLRRCYSEGFIFTDDEKPREDEIYTAAKDTIWGLSPEAAVCLVCPELGREEFLHKVFYKNFNSQYLFMYVLLLHQKYVLYSFLTKIGIGMHNDLDTLKEYRDELYEFETDFVFSCVTEVPQYQNLYDRMMKAFSLKQQYHDVREPLISLAEVRSEAAKAEQKKRDEKIEKALFVLSALAVFSALVDSFDLIGSMLGWFFNQTVVRIAQGCCVASIAAIIIQLFIWLRKSKEQ